MDNPISSISPISPQSTTPSPIESATTRWFLWILGGIFLVGLGIAIGVFGAKFLNQSQNQPQISSYEDCLTAKSSILQESYPATCVTASGARFTQPISAPTPESAIPTADPIADWKTYTNTKYGFSFKRPDFDEKCCGLAGAVSDNPTEVITLADITTVIPNSDAPFDGLAIYIIPNENNLTLDQYIEQEKTALFEQFKIMADPNMTHKGQVVRTKVADQPAVSLVDYSWDGITRTYFNHPNSKVIIEISKKEKSLNHFTFYNQILSTFKFVDNITEGTLEASVIRSPTCPGPVTEEKDCEVPYTNGTFNIVMLPDNQIVQAVSTDKDGKFTISLTAGSYKLQNSTGRIDKFGEIGGIGKNIRNSTFTITSGKTTIQKFDVDTGIR